VPLRAAMMGFPESLAGLAGRAAQVLEWDRTHRFCGACGTPTELQPANAPAAARPAATPPTRASARR
jgi:NADH pyrophosphatase NudC (nudix superfamily)